MPENIEVKSEYSLKVKSKAKGVFRRPSIFHDNSRTPVEQSETGESNQKQKQKERVHSNTSQ